MNPDPLAPMLKYEEAYPKGRGALNSAASLEHNEIGTSESRMKGVTLLGSEILEQVFEFLSRFVVYPSDNDRIAHTLWIAHTHRMDIWDSTPRIAFLSPEPGSGKSRALEITELLVPNPVLAVNTTPAFLFRKIADPDGLPTLLHDEIDTVFGPKARENEEIRGVLNAGHRKGAVAGRCVIRGTQIQTEELNAYCAVALAGLNDLPDTIMSRSIVVRMRRKTKREKVSPFRSRLHAQDGYKIRDELSSWCATLVSGIWPEMPEGIEDRDADCWEALLAIADAAGGDWPARARCAAVTLVTQSRERPVSIGIHLLHDLRTIFVAEKRESLFTEEILFQLNSIELSPWGDHNGKPLDSRGLARFLSKYGIKSRSIREGARTGKGYLLSDLLDVWGRYLDDDSPPQGTVTTVTKSQETFREDGNCSKCNAPPPRTTSFGELACLHQIEAQLKDQ